MKLILKRVRSCIYISHMGKSKKPVQPDKSVPLPAEKGPITLSASGDIRLSIIAKPGAKISAVTGIESEGVGVQIGARPVDGEANTELVLYISKVLGLKKSEVSLDKGSKSRQKVLIISSPQASIAEITEKLQAAIDE